jgi:hypothetical protein
LSNVPKLAAHPKFVWVFSANHDGTKLNITYFLTTTRRHIQCCSALISFILQRENLISD